MNEFNSEETKKRRHRDDSEFESNSPDSKRANSIPESHTESPRVYTDRIETSIETEDRDYIPEDLLDILNDTDIVQDRDSPSHDLDSVIRSFEEEIHQPTSNPNPTELADLGYLFGASDDELGLPPTTTATSSPKHFFQDPSLATSSSTKIEAKNDPIDLTIEKDGSNEIEAGKMIEFENELLSYDSVQLGMNEAPQVVDEGDFVTVDGIFDFSEPSDSTGLTWQPDSLPAL